MLYGIAIYHPFAYGQGDIILLNNVSFRTELLGGGNMDSSPLPNSNRKNSNNIAGTIVATLWPLVPKRRFKRGNEGRNLEVNG